MSNRNEMVARVFTDPESFATCLLAVGLDHFGSCVNWTPQTWVDEVRDTFRVDMHPRNLDRVMGMCQVLSSPDEFYVSEAGFNDIVQAIASEWFSPTTWHPPTTAECLWACVETFLIDPPDNRSTPRFSPDVMSYITQIARNEGFHSLPQVFTAFGVIEDKSVYAPYDYSEDASLVQAAMKGAQFREEDLDGWLAGELREYTTQLEKLPLTHGHGIAAVTGELKQFISK